MSSPHSDSYESHARKRVGKACDRCRLKKSKCDGSNPCSRCKIDNAICVFGERKKSVDKVYPKGYVEMLEQQQSQLVAGIREMYKKLLNGESWTGTTLPEAHDGHPLTHDILERLDVLHMTGDNPVKSEAFEDDLSRLQEKLLESGASYVRHRRSSVSSDSEPGLAHSDSPHSTPASQALSSFSESYSRKRSSPSTPPMPQSHQMPMSKKRHFATPEIQTMDADSMQLWQDQWVMQTPDMTDSLNGGSLFNNAYASPALDMYNPLSVNPLTGPSLNTMSQASMGNWACNDPEFDSFVRSGYHSTLA